MDADSVAQSKQVKHASGNSAVFFVDVDRMVLVALLGNQIEASGEEVSGWSCHGDEKSTWLTKAGRAGNM
jgi:hypothetical protein